MFTKQPRQVRDIKLETLETESFLPGDDYDTSQAVKQWALTPLISYVLNLILFTILLLFAFKRYASTYEDNSSACVEKLSSFSPALEVVTDNYTLVNFTATWLSDFKGGSDASERQWRDLMRVGVFSLDEQFISRVGGFEGSVRLPEESGGGYMAYLDYLHEVHCLYKIHQFVNKDYYTGRSHFWEMSGDLRKDHIEHCIDYLRQIVLCHADITVMTFDWYQDVPDPIPRFLPRKCRDWREIQEWAVEHQAPAPKEKLQKPPNAQELERPEGRVFLSLEDT